MSVMQVEQLAKRVLVNPVEIQVCTIRAHLLVSVVCTQHEANA